MAMACLRLVTLFPLRPLFSVPRFSSCIARSTFLPAIGLYFLPEDFFFVGIEPSPFCFMGATERSEVVRKGRRSADNQNQLTATSAGRMSSTSTHCVGYSPV